MRMEEIMADNYYNKKRSFKESVERIFFKNLQSKTFQKGKEVTEGNYKEKSKEVKKLSWDEVQEQIKKGMCFKCVEKWDKDHHCKFGYVLMIAEPSDNQDRDDNNEEEFSDNGEFKVINQGESDGEVELSLNIMLGAPRPATMRLLV